MPAQTRGFLFSDLRGYSAFTERHGDRAARELLVRYRQIVREAVASFGGAEIRTEGDSFYVVFDSVSQAVEAGLAIQAGLAAAGGEPIRAGIGIHAGEVEDDAEHGIVSSAVNIAARICAAAEPGEVLVSETVHGLTRGYLEVGFVPRGRRKLKGIRDPVPVYRVTAEVARPAARLRPGALAVAFGTIGLATVAVAWVVTLSGIGAGGTPSASSTISPASVSASQRPSSATSSETSASSAPDEAFPTSDEQRLTALVDRSFWSSCKRAATDSVPPMVGLGDPATTGRSGVQHRAKSGR